MSISGSLNTNIFMAQLYTVLHRGVADEIAICKCRGMGIV